MKPFLKKLLLVAACAFFPLLGWVELCRYLGLHDGFVFFGSMVIALVVGLVIIEGL